MKHKYRSLFLSNQPFFIKEYKGKKVNYNEDLYKLISQNLNLLPPDKNFKLTESKRHTIEEMASPPLTLNFYAFIAKLINPKNVLEIGTFVGVSALNMAQNTPKTTKIVTLEKFDEFKNIAQKNFRDNHFEKKIKILLGDANNTLLKLKKKKFDLVFIDGDKGNYLSIFKLIEKNNIKKNSIIIVDNYFFHGDVVNKKPRTEKGKGVKALINYIEKNDNFTKTILPIYDGILLLKKK
jgi:caffeoyl-CoA O-methyltransferase